ncbi:MAG: hypothetical protein RBR15_04585 [Sphaerochaeta sp.]|nr:hypothetical protein [Sphaerochaeta sp.]
MRKPILALLLLVLCSSLSAGAWSSIETVHTTIIFEERDAPSAQSLASFADEVLLELASLLEHMPKRKVVVILAGRPAFSNGMFAPFPSSIILYLTSPVDRFLGSRSSSWLRSLYTHELTHYLHLTSPVGPARYLFFLGPEVPAMNAVLMPQWWVEGITTYTESEYAQGGRGDSPLFALTWQAPMLQSSLWTLSQGRYNSAFPPSGRIYSTGYLMVDYLMRHYGKESFARVNKDFAWFPFLGMNSALKKETGFSSKALFSLAIEEQQALLPQGTSLGLQFSPQGLGDHYLPTTTDLGLVGYANSPKRGGTLVRYAPDGEVQVLKDLPYVEHDSLFFTPTQVLFSYTWADPFHPSYLPLAPVSYNDLMLYHYASDSFRRITEGEMLTQPVISEDGGSLFAIKRTEERHMLVTVDADTGSLTTVYDNARGSVYEPVLAGEAVVVVQIVEGDSSLVAIDREGGATTLVPPTRSEIRSPSFSGGRLLFVSDDTGFLALYAYDLSSGELSLLHSDPQGVLGGRIEGDVLLYETYTAEGVALKRVGLEQIEAVPVTLQGPLAYTPSSQALVEKIFPTRRFIDYPRLNLVLPYPFVRENSVQPGLWFHSQSLLRRQLLIAQVGWDIDRGKAVGALDYLYNPGPFSVGVQASFGKEKRASVTLSVPLLYRPSLYNYKLLSLQGSFALVTQDSDLLYSFSTRVGAQVKGRGRPNDFFGTPFGSVAVGVEAKGMNWAKVDQARLFGLLAAQVRMFCSSQMLGLRLDGVTDSKGQLENALLYEGFSDKGLDGDAKARLTVRFHIPFGPLDLPIPYGGMTGLGLSLTAQSALYLEGSSLLWDREVVLSGALTASAVVGSGLAVRPFVLLAYRVGDGKASLTVGLNGGALLVTKEH